MNANLNPEIIQKIKEKTMNQEKMRRMLLDMIEVELKGQQYNNHYKNLIKTYLDKTR